MAGVLIGTLLISSLLLVHYSMRRKPLDLARPLDEDEGLPLPEFAQASTLFSLTALFGAYFGIYLVLGLPALCGLALGTLCGFLFLKQWILKHPSGSFEGFLLRVLSGGARNVAVFAICLAGVQSAYATSELLILRDVAGALLALRPEHATVLALGIGVVGYFYVVFGGYRALFRTDVVQFCLVAAMVLALGVGALQSTGLSALIPVVLPRDGYWMPPTAAAPLVRYAYQFIVATVMGFGFIVASPDAWKRVYLVVAKRPSPLRFTSLVAVGTLPFVILLPLAGSAPPVPDGPTSATQMLAGLLSGTTLFVIGALGLVASFLSAFNSALLLSVHVGLIAKRIEAPAVSEMSRFHWLMAGLLLSICLLYLSLSAAANAYLLASALLGPYALIAGIQIGTAGRLSRIPDGSVLWIAVSSMLPWFAYVSRTLSFVTPSTTYQVNNVPAAAALCLGVAAACGILSFWVPSDAV